MVETMMMADGLRLTGYGLRPLPDAAPAARLSRQP